MKLVAATVLATVLLTAESTRLGGYNLPSPIISFGHGSSSTGRGSGSISSHSQGTSGSFVSSGHGTGGSFTSPGQSTGGSFVSSGHGTGGSFGSSGQGFGGSFSGTTSCSGGQVLHVDGRCVTPEVQRKVYVYDVPKQPQTDGPPPHIPLPKIEHNILFVRLPESAGGQDPIIVPPPHQKNIVYVLSKGDADAGQKVINVPAPPKTQPEIYFVDYEDGENPTLPGGVDLQTALSSAAHQGIGQVIDGGGSTVGTSGGFIGAGSTGGISGGIIGSGAASGISGEFIGGGSTGGISGGSAGGVSAGFIGSGSTGGSVSTGGTTLTGSSFLSGGSSSGGTVISSGAISQPSSLYSTP